VGLGCTENQGGSVARDLRPAPDPCKALVGAGWLYVPPDATEVQCGCDSFCGVSYALGKGSSSGKALTAAGQYLKRTGWSPGSTRESETDDLFATWRTPDGELVWYVVRVADGPDASAAMQVVHFTATQGKAVAEALN
jgi:hypothetical protein